MIGRRSGDPGSTEESTTSGFEKASRALARELRTAVNEQNFRDVLDIWPVESGATVSSDDPGNVGGYKVVKPDRVGARQEPKPIHQSPNVDVLVVELGDDGRPRAAANVLVSPQYPDGVIVPVDRNLHTDQVRWRKWDDSEWDTNNGLGTEDVIPGLENAPIEFTSPYPASVLKLMVGFGILRLVDAGELGLDREYTYTPVGDAPCGGEVTRTISDFFDRMITVSDNQSTCALIKLLHEKDYIDTLNQDFTDLGMPLLRLVGTNPDTGGTWIHANMNALDTAKLLLIVNGGDGVLWRTPDGEPVTRDVLSAKSRKFFLSKLADQGLNEVLSTTNWCGREYPAPGLPQRISERWINPNDGTVTVGDRYYGQDVRPCQASAEVTFDHKTGWVDTSSNDAGIVRSLPGKDKRNYIVVMYSNLGYRYVDPNRPEDPPGVYPVPQTEKVGKLGRAIDDIMVRRSQFSVLAT